VSTKCKPNRIYSEDNGTEERQVKALEEYLRSGEILNLSVEEAATLVEELDQVRSRVSTYFYQVI
jgi:hypothetical protein